MALADRVANLTAHYPLNEASGSALETVGSLDATENATVGAGTGLFTAINAARDFEADSPGYFNRADNAAFDLGDTDWTIRLAFKVESLPYNLGLVGKSAGGASGYWVVIKPAYVSGENRVTFTVNDGVNSPHEAIDGTSLATATNYIVWCGHDATNNLTFIRVNGGTKVTESWSTGVATNADDFTIGRVVWFYSYHDGLIGDLAVLNVVMSDAEMDEDWNGGDPIPVADWAGAPPAGNRRRRLLLGAA